MGYPMASFPAELGAATTAPAALQKVVRPLDLPILHPMGLPSAQTPEGQTKQTKKPKVTQTQWAHVDTGIEKKPFAKWYACSL